MVASQSMAHCNQGSMAARASATTCAAENAMRGSTVPGAAGVKLPGPCSV